MVFVTLLAIAAVVAAVVLAVRVRRQGLALGAAADRIGTLQGDLDAVRNDRAQQALRADTAEAARDDARTQVTALEREIKLAASSLADAMRVRDNALDQVGALLAAQLGSADATALWLLELARVERRWHVSVAPGIDLTSPLTDTPPGDQARVAIEIIASALREETGTRFTIDWQLPHGLPVSASLLLVRAGDEMLAGSALACDTVVLHVAEVDKHVALTLEAFDDEGEPVVLPPLTFLAGLPKSALPHTVIVDGSTVRIPLSESARSGVAA